MDVATGIAQPAWPLPDVEPRRVATYGGRAFGAQRAGSGRARRHAGLDIIAPRGSVVVAMEDGELVAEQPFLGAGAVALLEQTDSGIVILYGEVEPDSWREFGVGVGTTVQRGQPIARVGVTPGGSSMLHLETYRSGTRRNARWWADSFPPPELLDPTHYLEAAAAGEPISPVETDDHDHGDDVVADASDTTMPDTNFDPTAKTQEQWVDRDMTPEDFAVFYEDGYRPVGRYQPQQIACAQNGGTYRSGSSTCELPSGEVCDAMEYLRGNCPAGPSAELPDVQVDPGEVDPGDSEDAGEGGDDIDPFPLFPDIGPSGDKGFGLFALLALAFLSGAFD